MKDAVRVTYTDDSDVDTSWELTMVDDNVADADDAMEAHSSHWNEM